MKLNDGVVIQALGDAYVAYDNSSSVLHEFNEIGFRIIELISEGFDQVEIKRKIIEEYDGGDDQANVDVDEFLITLEKKDLIVL